MNRKEAVLENEYLKIVITHNGTIKSLYHKRTNTELIHTENVTGWRIITTLGEWKEHPIFDHENEGEIIHIGDQIQVRFTQLLGSERDTLDISLTLTFSIKSNSDEVQMVASIHNRSDETVREIMFPYISGFTKLNEKLADSLVLPLEMGVIMDEPLVNLPVAYKYGIRPRPGGNFFAMEFWQHYPLPYPGVACMPWLDYFNAQQGIYLGYHDNETPTTAILARKSNEENTFQLGFSRYPFIEPDEQWDSGRYIVKLHGGDWHEGAKCYQEYAKTKIESAVNSPEWIRECSGLHFSFHVGQNRHIRSTYDIMVEKFRRNQQLGLNLPLFVFGWVKTGFDNCYPEYEPDPRLGGAEKLKQVIKTITDEGGKVILYTQGRLIDKSTEYYKNTGHSVCLRNEYGTEYIDEYSFNDKGTIYPGKVFALGCPATEGWYEQLKKQIDIVMDLGASGILFDQIAGDPPFLCFDTNHPHKKPDMAFDAKIRLLRRLQEYAHSKDPDFVIMSELICDVYLQCVDLTHGMATSRDSEKPVRYLPEMYKYVFPQHRITSRQAVTRKAYNQIFAMGFVAEYHSNLPDLDYLESLLKLRTKLERFFVNGIFKDTEGVSVEPENLFVKVFLTADGEEKAVIAVNESNEKISARISIDRNRQEWQIISPMMERPVDYTTVVNSPFEFDLEPNEMKIAIIK